MSNTVHFQARGRTVVGCTLLVIALGASVTACSGDADDPLSATPYDAAGQISFNGPTDAGKKADPCLPTSSSRD